jgi:hypothetical protein
MKAKIAVPPLGWLARLADWLMVPLMYLLSGTFKEVPQGGHRWNNLRLSRAVVENLDQAAMVHCPGINDKTFRSRWLFLFHIPILGGWRNYVVLEPENPECVWHVGYIADDIVGVSRVRLLGRVRMLVGPGDVAFYGIDAETYQQIALKNVGKGRIGAGGEFAKEKLL